MLTLWTWKVTNLGGSEHWSTFWSTASTLGLHNDFNRKHRSLVVRSRRVCRKIILFSSSFRADTWFWSIHSSHDPFEIYGWKCSGYLILLCSSSLRWHRPQNSTYFCVFKYARAVKQKVWNEAENRERDWLARFARIRVLHHALPISLLILRGKPTVLQSSADKIFPKWTVFVFTESWSRDQVMQRKVPFCRSRPGYNLGNISSVTWRTLWILRRDVFELEQTISLEKNQDFSGSHICKGTLSIDRLLCASSSKLYKTLLNRVVFKILRILVTHWPLFVLEFIDFLNPLSPKSDQYQIPLCNINALLYRAVMRTTDTITQNEFAWYFISFSPQLL